jgi:hypothetical protein
MNQRCSENNGLPKDEDSKLKKEEEKEKRMQAAETYIISCHYILSCVLHSDALIIMPRLLRQDCQVCSANLPVRKTCGKHDGKHDEKHAKCTFMTVCLAICLSGWLLLASLWLTGVCLALR